MEGHAFRGKMQRRDKFQLAGGSLMFAPRYPQWLESPGFWDDLWWHDEAIPAACTWSLLDADRRPIPLTFTGRTWQPGASDSRYHAPEALVIDERRYIAADNTLTCLLTIANGGTSAREFDLVFWSRQPHEEQGARISEIEGSVAEIRFLRRAPGRRGPFETVWQFAADRRADSWAVYSSERFGGPPRWQDTPFASGWRGSLLPAVSINDEFPWGPLWPALHFNLRIPAGGNETISLRLCIDAPERPATPITVVPAAAHNDLNERAWNSFFDGVPSFICDAPLWEHLWRYRWYLLRQNLKRGGDVKQPRPGVCEGSEIFHQPISYSTPAIVFDLRWHRDAAPARDNLLNFSDCQEDNGRLPGALHHDRFRPEFFYHADWGRAVSRLQQVHPDRAFLHAMYPALARYGTWLKTARDPEDSGMIDIINHMETGQEFNTRYLPANPAFDGEGWDREFRLKGVDSTVYAWFLWRTLEEIARTFSLPDDAERWAIESVKTTAALHRRMWQADGAYFSDLLPPAMSPTGIQTLTNFYPFLTGHDLAPHLGALRRLVDPEQFWTPVPVATLSQGDDYFDADARWKGKTRSCTWNGRVWPMTNSHMVEVLARASEIDPQWRAHGADLFIAFANLFDAEGDGFSLSSWEHYHPIDGSPCRYRGIDDYLHCWVIDLIVRFAAGFQPQRTEGEIVIDPWQLGIGDFVLTDLPFRGSLYDIAAVAGVLTVRRDGRRIAEGSGPLRIGGGR